MTVASSVSRTVVYGNSSATSFAYTFPIASSSHLVVTKTDADGTDTTLTLGAHYSVSGVGSPSGGSITYPLSGSALVTGARLTMRRVVPLTQLTDLTNQGAFYAEVHESEFDNGTFVDQQLQEQVSRAILVPTTDVSPSLTLPRAADRASKYLMFDASGNPSVVAGGTSGQVLLAVTATGDNTTTAYSLPASLSGSSSAILVGVDGAVQRPDTYAVAGSTLTFGVAPPSGAVIDIRVLTSVDAASSATAAAASAAAAAASAATVLAVTDVIAPSDGVTSALAILQAALTSGAKYLRLPAGNYLCNGTLTIPTGVVFEGEGDGTVLINATIETTGTYGSEVPVTVAAARGDTTLTVDTSGLAVGDWVYIKSVTNALSSDAGADRLGVPTGSFLGAYFSEFARVNSLTSTVLTIAGATLFPYTITAGGSSGVRTTSTVAKVTFSQGGAIRRMKFSGADGSPTYVIKPSWARNFVIEDCTIDMGSTYTPVIQPENCLGVKVLNCRIITDPYGIGSATPSRNSIRLVACQDCVIDGCDVEGGYQCADVTYTDLSGVSTGNTIQNCTFRNALEGATTHSGVYGGSISNNRIIDCLGGIRVRSMFTRVIGNEINGKLSGIGINVTSGFSGGIVVSGNTITGQLYGIVVDHESDIGTVDASLYPGRCVISNNTIRNASTGILAYGNIGGATTRLSPSLIRGNVIDACRNRGIYVVAYTNGVTIDGNLITGPFDAASRAGIEWGANVQYLSVVNNVLHYLGASIYGLRGPGTGSMMTDLTTFPAGEAEAYLTLRDNLVLGFAAAFESTGILRNAGAYTTTTQTIGTHQTQGRAIVKQLTSVTGNVQEWQSSAGSVVLGVDQAGKLTGSIATTAKAAIAAAADVAALKTALAGLFA